VFERFTDSARRVVVLAQEEARYLHHHGIGTEHLLLALMVEGESPAALTLQDLGYGIEDLRAEIEEAAGPVTAQPSADTSAISFTPQCKKVLELSLRESLSLSHSFIGPEHMLLGLLKEQDGLAARLLLARGPSLNMIRRQVLNRMHAATPVMFAAERPAHNPLEDVERRLEAIEIRLSALEDRLDG
jgi:ATP-dependent Clp protease ATP-binding subunit ClpC